MDSDSEMVSGGSPPRLQLLGSFDLNYGGRSVTVAPAGQRLLTLLVLSRHVLPRESVAERLWPDASGTRAAGCLRSALWRLPKTPQALVAATPGTVRLAPGIETDISSAEDTLRRAIAGSERTAQEPEGGLGVPEVALADQALSSDLLPEVWDDWVIAERERLRQLRLHALESLSRAHREAGHFGRSLDAALLAVAGEPLRESARREAIDTYLAEGNTVEAVRHFVEFRRLLREDLGLPPSPALRQVMNPWMSAAQRRG